MDPCRIIITDLKENKKWVSAFPYNLFDKPVVLARQYSDSSLVVVIPLTKKFSVSDLSLFIDRSRQLAVDICSDKVNFTNIIEDFDDIEIANNSFSVPAFSATPDIFDPQQQVNKRFTRDTNFTPEKCQKIHNNLIKFESEFNQAKQKEELWKHKAAEIQLGLDFDVNDNQNEAMTKCDTNCTIEDRKLNDFYLSVIFALMEGPTIAYYQAAYGLAPPFVCPDDSDDEKPIEVVCNEQNKLKRSKENQAEN